MCLSCRKTSAEKQDEIQCQRCDAVVRSTIKRGRRPKWCERCLRLVRTQQEKSRKAKRKELGSDKPHRLTCLRCGVSFACSRRNQKYCSVPCSRIASRSRKRLSCDSCGKRFECREKQSEARRFCSRECWLKLHRRPVCKCEQCGKDFPRKCYVTPRQGKNRFCSRECAWDHRWGKDRPRKGGSKRARISWAQKSRATTLKHRCEHYGCHFDPACTREAVCERDGWVCQRCGIQCNKGEYLVILGTRRVDPKNADHDHIWPLSIPGGPGNVLSNSQCLCRKCNGKKRANGGSQLRLAYAG